MTGDMLKVNGSLLRAQGSEKFKKYSQCCVVEDDIPACTLHLPIILSKKKANFVVLTILYMS